MIDRKSRKSTGGAPPADLMSLLTAKVVGQPDVMEAIIPCIEMFQAGLAPEHRPAGVFLLLGPTGTGKTRTVEALAEALHGSVRNVLKIDCGEFQMEHEVAKLIGAPPGYLGHRETQPLLSQQKLTSVTTDDCPLAIVLFDEIEKAAPSLARLLLGVLDRGVLRLGDNSSVDFERSIIFLTSNLGAREMSRAVNPQFGFQATGGGTSNGTTKKLRTIAMGAVKRRFSPEFVNRIDHVIMFRSLDSESFAAIAQLEIRSLQRHIDNRLGARAFELDVPFATRQWLIERGTSEEYGARELKRTIHRHLTQPLATKVAKWQVQPGCRLRVDVAPDRQSLSMRMMGVAEGPSPVSPTVLVAESNKELLSFIERIMREFGWEVLPAETAAAAKKLAAKKKPNAALLNLDLPDSSGIVTGIQLAQLLPGIQVTVMAGANIDQEEEAICRQEGFLLIRKPFLVTEVMTTIRKRLLEAA